MQHPGWILLALGIIIALFGAVWLVAGHIPWLGKLPGDLVIKGEHVRFYLPITTSILLSLLLTGILWLIRFFAR